MVSEVVESDVAKDDVFTTVVCIVFLVVVGVVTTFVWSFVSSVYWLPSSIENLVRHYFCYFLSFAPLIVHITILGSTSEACQWYYIWADSGR